MKIARITIISSASCELCVALCPAALQPHSFMHLSQVGWTAVARSRRACLWLKLPVLIGFFAVPPVSLGAYRNMVLFRLIIMRDKLHWLPIARRISYRIAVLVWWCLLGSAPGYLCELCRLVFGLHGRRPLRSSVTVLASYWCLVLKL